MPSTGIPSSSSSRSRRGAPSAYTDAGPPERIRPLGRRRATSSAPTWWGNSSLNTPHSRTRRAISCEYWPPKSRTTTSSRAVSGGRSSTVSSETVSVPVTPLAAVGVAGTAAGSVIAYGYPGGHRGPPVGAHAHGLLALELLALGLERRRDHHLGALEVADVLVSAGRHRGLERTDEVEGAVVLLGGAEHDLLERAVLDGGDPRAARQRRVEGGHAPVVATARGLLGAGERRADHDRVGAAG